MTIKGHGVYGMSNAYTQGLSFFSISAHYSFIVGRLNTQLGVNYWVNNTYFQFIKYLVKSLSQHDYGILLCFAGK